MPQGAPQLSSALLPLGSLLWSAQSTSSRCLTGVLCLLEQAVLFGKYPSQHGSDALLNSAKVIVPPITIPVKEILTIHLGNAGG